MTTQLALNTNATKTPRFVMLPDREKDRIKRLLAIMDDAFQSARPMTVLAKAAARMIDVPGFGRTSLVRFYYRLKNGEDWTCMIRKYSGNDAEVELDLAIKDLWWKYCGRNQRGKCRAAHRRFLEDLRADRIVGHEGLWRELWQRDYETQVPPEKCPRDFVPDGWSYNNFMSKKNRPTKFEQTAATIGRQAAAQYRPLVWTTRVGSRVGQGLIFDDLWHDLKVNHIGNARAMRPLELSVLDFTSGCKFDWGFKPMLEDIDDATKKTICGRDMLFFTAHVFHTFGYRPDGTFLFVEHGTAAIPEQLEKYLYDWTDGAIRVKRSDIVRDPAFAGLYEGPARGNPRIKAALESHHNLSHNETAHLIGQMGKDRDHAPEEMYGRDAYNRNLLKAMELLPVALARRILLPNLEFNRFVQFADMMYDVINWRTWHRMQGWLECGFTREQFLIKEGLDWFDEDVYLNASPQERAALDAIITQPGHHRSRKLAPQEVFDAGRRELIRFPGWIVPMILGPAGAMELKAENDHLFHFVNQDIHAEELMYEAVLHTPKNRIEDLRPGETYLVHVNPFDMDKIYISKSGTGEGSFLGYCKRWARAPKFDEDAIALLQEKVAMTEMKLLKPVRARNADLAAEKEEMEANNEAVISYAKVAASTGADEPRPSPAADKINVVDLINKKSKTKKPSSTTSIGGTSEQADQSAHG